MKANEVLNKAIKEVRDIDICSFEIIGEFKNGREYCYITDGANVCLMEVKHGYDCVIITSIENDGHKSMTEEYAFDLGEIRASNVRLLLSMSIKFNAFIQTRSEFRGYHFIKPEDLKKKSRPKLVKGTYRHKDYFEYEINGEPFYIEGELYWNREKNRLEHEHIGKRGGKYLVYWNF